MNIYISGPITSDPQGYREKFKAAEIDIRDAGHSPFNPVTFNERNEGLTYEQLMANDLALLDLADAILVLDGWQNSCGSNREYGYALAKGMKILTMETLTRSYDE